MAVVTDGQTAVLDEVVADKGYHSNQVLVDLGALDLRTYIAEPNRGRRNWKKKTVARDAVYANRRRIRAARVGWLCSGGGANISNGRTHISTKPAACGGRMCAGMRTSSNACSSKQAPSTWASSCGH